MTRLQAELAGSRWVLLMGLLVCTGCRANPRWTVIPGGACRLGVGRTAAAVSVKPFALGTYEVTVREYTEYLNEVGRTVAGFHPQLRGETGHYRPALGLGQHPIAHVCRADAESYCDWLSGRMGKLVRLPTPVEWEYAARAGRSNVRYGWGWGSPEGRACFDAAKAAGVGRYDPNPFGLYDMGGNVAEWCSGDGAEGEVRGGSWADRSPASLAVYAGATVPAAYRDADVGFRMRVELRAPGPS